MRGKITLRERVLQLLLLGVLIVLLLVIVYSDKNYNDLLDTNDSLLNTLEESRVKNDEIINNWQMAYEQLQLDYGEVLIECEQLKTTGVEVPTFQFTPAEVQVLAECVQCEAGVGNPLSQKYVCSVILNRLASDKYPNTIEEVIYQKVDGNPQFSVAYNGAMDSVELDDEVLLNTYRTIVYGSYLLDYVLYFYSETVDENWVNTLNVYTTVEGTVFAYE